MMTIADRVMILGLDGATWSVLDPMRARGFMPNLDALLKRSAHGTLRSTIPPVDCLAMVSLLDSFGFGRRRLRRSATADPSG